MGIKLDKVVSLEVDDEEVVQRLSSRIGCSKCGEISTCATNLRSRSVCDKCGAELFVRKDDQPETIRERLRVFHKTTKPVVDYYDGSGRVAARRRNQPGDDLLRNRRRPFDDHSEVSLGIEKMRAAGRILARALRLMGEAIEPGKTSTADLDALGERIVREAGGVPSFKGYRGYPASVCIEVNDVVVHGIPDGTVLARRRHRRARPRGYAGRVVCRRGLDVPRRGNRPRGSTPAQREQREPLPGNRQSAPGSHGGRHRGGRAEVLRVERLRRRSRPRGPRIGRTVHEEPNVPNFGKAGKGPVLREGATICIEPMVNQGTYKVKTLPDKWTMVTADGKLSAHFEHTIAITRDGPEILTLE